MFDFICGYFKYELLFKYRNDLFFLFINSIIFMYFGYV